MFERVIKNLFLLIYIMQGEKCRPSPEHAQAEPLPRTRFGRALAYAGSALRRAAAFGSVAVPLIAASAGCEQDSCSSHNVTTVSLNQPSDGRIASLQELMEPPEGGLVISPAAIDLLNEAHSLSSGGMPPDSSLTLVEKTCFGPTRLAFACHESNIVQDRGIYVPSPVVLLSRSPSAVSIMTMFHELGHLQEGGHGNEILPDLNKFEQALMVHVLLSRNDPSSQKDWAVLVRGLEDAIYYPTVPSGYRDFGTVQKTEAFIIMELIRHDGDFGAARAHVRQLVSLGGIDRAVEDAVRSYAEQYGDLDPVREANNLANLAGSLRISFARHLSTRFGMAEAVAYLNALSAKVSMSEEGLTRGLDGMVCAIMDSRNMFFQSATAPNPSQVGEMCPEMRETVSVRDASEGTRLCCVSPEAGPAGLTFRKFIVMVGGYECTGSTLMHEYPSGGVKHLNVEAMDEISIDSQCE